MQAPKEAKDPIGDFYKKTYGKAETPENTERRPTTVYEKGQYLLELRQRALSAPQTVAVVVAAAVVTVIVAYAAIAILG